MSSESFPPVLRRSQLYHWHQQQGASFDMAGPTLRVLRYPDEQAPALSLTDLSTHPRVGFKGVGTRQWLQQLAIDMPQTPNCATRQPDGSLLARLSEHEHLLLDNLAADAPLPAELLSRWELEQPSQCYALPRADSHSWMILAGTDAAAMMSSLCAVDLRPQQFADGSIAQTSVARTNTIVIRDDNHGLRYHLLCDASTALYLWNILLESVTAFGGQATGVEHLL